MSDAGQADVLGHRCRRGDAAANLLAQYGSSGTSPGTRKTVEPWWPESASPDIAPTDPGGCPGASGGARFPVHRRPDGSATRSPGRRRAMARRQRAAGRTRRRVRAPLAASMRETTRALLRAPEPAPVRRATHAAATNRESPRIRPSPQTPRAQGDTGRTMFQLHGPVRAVSNEPPQVGRAAPVRSRGRHGKDQSPSPHEWCRYPRSGDSGLASGKGSFRVRTLSCRGSSIGSDNRG